MCSGGQVEAQPACHERCGNPQAEEAWAAEAVRGGAVDDSRDGDMACRGARRGRWLPRMGHHPSARVGGVFWKAAVLAGGRAVGLRESEVVVREWGGAVFPKDYPMMPAGWLWHENEAARSRTEWTRRPPQYRLVQRDAHPFGGGQMWKELSSGEDAAAGRGSGGGLVRLRLAVRGRGRPVPNAAVLSGETGALIGFVLAGGYSRRLGRGWGDALARACDVLENVGGVGAHGGGIVVKIVGPEGVENGEFFAWARPV